MKKRARLSAADAAAVLTMGNEVVPPNNNTIPRQLQRAGQSRSQ